MPSGRTAEVPWPIRLGVLPKTVLGHYPNREWGSTPIANGVLPQCKSGHYPQTSICRLAKRQGSALNATRPRKKFHHPPTMTLTRRKCGNSYQSETGPQKRFSSFETHLKRVSPNIYRGLTQSRPQKPGEVQWKLSAGLCQETQKIERHLDCEHNECHCVKDS